jgi:flagellar basal body-associated protein FliL
MAKKKSKKKKASKKKLSNNNLMIIIGVVAILVILVGFCIMNEGSTKEGDENESPILDILTPKLSPLELSENKENYEGKEIIVLGAYIPSEAFIYIKEVNQKIYLKPANKAYCRNYDLEGTLKYNYVTSKWELEVKNYDNCLD